MFEIGEKIPDITLISDKGENVNISKDFMGKKLVIYFYPKDNTSGCTKQAISINESLDELKELNVHILGISPDDTKSHVKFKDAYNLNFTLLSDTDHKCAETFGVWKEKKMYGKTYMGIVRTTFIFDENGELVKVFPKVKASEHGKELLKFLK